MNLIISELGKSENIKNVERYSRGEQEFQRMIKFQIEEQEYIIEWYSNMCKLYIGKAQVIFDKVRFSGTWSNEYKENLQFYDGKNEVVCIIGVDKYPE